MMNLNRLLRDIAPVAAIAIAAGLSGCKNVDININSDDGVPLAELDTSGPPPHELILAGPDSVVVTDGDALTIQVEGDASAVDALRFNLDDESLGIRRENGNGGSSKGVATIRVTMPPARKITIAGSGGVAAQSMASDAKVTIAGSGRLDIGNLTAERLNVNIAGSGTFGAAGKVDTLDLTIAGSGDMEARGLQVQTAKLSVVGSGDAEFASDGTVTARVVGSGGVTVYGKATCTVDALGSGKVTCRPDETNAD